MHTDKCCICDRNTKEMYSCYPPRCADTDDCFKHRKTTRIVDQMSYRDLPAKYIPDADEQMRICNRNLNSMMQMQMADFVVLSLKNGGIMFVKDRHEDSKGKVFFAE